MESLLSWDIHTHTHIYMHTCMRISDIWKRTVHGVTSVMGAGKWLV
jgi:hypothetical protein